TSKKTSPGITPATMMTPYFLSPIFVLSGLFDGDDSSHEPGRVSIFAHHQHVVAPGVGRELDHREVGAYFINDPPRSSDFGDRDIVRIDVGVILRVCLGHQQLKLAPPLLVGMPRASEHRQRVLSRVDDGGTLIAIPGGDRLRRDVLARVLVCKPRRGWSV